MRLFLVLYSYFVILLLSGYTSAYDQKPEGVTVKVSSNNELLQCFEKRNYQEAPNIQQLHIAYEVPPILLNGLFPESEGRLLPQIKHLRSLNLNRQKKDYKPFMPRFLGITNYGALPLKFVVHLKHLTSLDLSHMQIEMDSEPFANPLAKVDVSPLASLPKLKTLILKHTNLTLFRDFSKFQTLTELDLSHNDFIHNWFKPNDEFKNLSTLVSLNLSYTNIENFPHYNPFLFNLEKLNVAHNYHLQIAGLTSLTSLTELIMAETINLQCNELIHLSVLTKLAILDVSNNSVLERNLIQLLKMGNLKTIYISERARYGNNFDKHSKLLQTTEKELIFCEYERDNSDDDRSFDVEGLVTSEDFIEYNDRWSRSH